jgi:hypothetical protein
MKKSAEWLVVVVLVVAVGLIGAIGVSILVAGEAQGGRAIIAPQVASAAAYAGPSDDAG